jgi:hypothetical protein
MQSLLALATLGDETQIEMILFVSHHLMGLRQARWAFSWCKTANNFANGSLTLVLLVSKTVGNSNT